MLRSTSKLSDSPKDPDTPDSLTSELSDLRTQSCLRLKSAWESIIERYGRNLDNEVDEIDLVTEKVVVDRGFVRNAKVVKVGSLIRGWGLTDDKTFAEHEPVENEYDEHKYDTQASKEIFEDNEDYEYDFRANAELWCLPDEQFSTSLRPLTMNHKDTLPTSPSSTSPVMKTFKPNPSSVNPLISKKIKASKVKDRLRKNVNLMDWESSESVTASSQEEDDGTRWMTTKYLKVKRREKEGAIKSSTWRKKYQMIQERNKKKKKEREEAEWQSAIEKGIIYLPEGLKSPQREEVKNEDTPRKKETPKKSICESGQGAIVNEKAPLAKDEVSLTESLPLDTPIPSQHWEIDLTDEKLDEFEVVLSPRNNEERPNFINLVEDEDEGEEEKEKKIEAKEEEEKENDEERENTLTESNNTVTSLHRLFVKCGGPGICQKTFCFSCFEASTDGIFVMV